MEKNDKEDHLMSMEDMDLSEGAENVPDLGCGFQGLSFSDMEALFHSVDSSDLADAEAAVETPSQPAEKSGFISDRSFQNPLYTEQMDTRFRPLDSSDFPGAAPSCEVPSYEAPSQPAERTGFVPDKPFQNDLYVDGAQVVRELQMLHEMSPSPSGEYVGPSPDALNLKIDEDVKHLTYCQEQLDWAIAHDTGVMTAMQNVENAKAVLDAHMNLYNEAIKFRAPDGQKVAAQTAGAAGVAFGSSVSHAQWELEQAYKNDNKIAIQNAKRDLAHELAKQDAKDSK